MNHPESCLQCGDCVAVCPVEMVGGHAIVSFLAHPDSADYSEWLCTSCWRCQEVCPGGVDIYGLMMEQRRREPTLAGLCQAQTFASAVEPAPAGYQAAFESVLACGLALEVAQEELDQVRAAWGLEPVRLPPPGLAQALLRGNE